PAPPDDERLVPVAVREGDDGVADWGEASWAPAFTEPVMPPVGEDPGREDPGREDPDGEDRAGEDRAELDPAEEFAAGQFAGEELATGELAAEDTLPAPGPCAGCGFFVRLGGPLGQVFGVCANAYAPDDGRVVSVDHGCGAHSES